MQIRHIPFEKVPYFSARDIAYTTQNESIQPFQKYPTKLEAFREVIRDKKEQAINRRLLVEVLREQYQWIFPESDIPTNVEKITEENTFTLTTAHQPSLFTGPLYFIYKILSVITLSRQLKEEFPEYHFVPVFVGGGEDHDFEEINHLNLFGKRVEWRNDEQGAVGKMKTTTLQAVLAELEEILGSSERAQEIFRLIKSCYTEQSTYGAATLAFVHELFGKEGLIVLDMSHPRLKEAFAPIMRRELLEQPSEGIVNQTSKKLEALGYKQQATPRSINLFYLNDQLRERIEKTDGRYTVLNTNISFSEDEILEELNRHPERFSPNVVMRPIYQELILPNLAYVGGGGEIAYWLERKAQFEHFGINYPMLVRRHSVLWIDKGNAKKMDKLGLSLDDLLEEDVELIIKKFVKDQADEPLNLKAQKKQLSALFNEVAELAKRVDPTLVKSVKAEMTNQIKSLSQLEGRLVRAEKQKHDIAINQIRNLKEKLFPGNGLQERYDNFLNFYLRYGDDFMETLCQNFQPLSQDLLVIVDQ
jgi:bacillithiol biosynthesis cysteine-adding enzyme BshC